MNAVNADTDVGYKSTHILLFAGKYADLPLNSKIVLQLQFKFFRLFFDRLGIAQVDPVAVLVVFAAHAELTHIFFTAIVIEYRILQKIYTISLNG